jgi:hypothetical protein
VLPCLEFGGHGLNKFCTLTGGQVDREAVWTDFAMRSEKTEPNVSTGKSLPRGKTVGL